MTRQGSAFLAVLLLAFAGLLATTTRPAQGDAATEKPSTKRRTRRESDASRAAVAARDKRTSEEGSAPDPIDQNESSEPAAFDPVKVNGPIFKDWRTPDMAVVITGELLGYIEPCGCAGRENQKGGIARRDSFLKQLRDKGWPLLTLDVGGLIHRFGRQTEIKYQTLVEAYRLMGYDAIGFGAEDLKLPATELLSATADLPATDDGQEQPSPCVSANVGLFGFDSEQTHRYRVVRVGDKTIGITSILGDEFQQEVNNDDLEFRPAREALRDVLQQLAQEKCDQLVLLSYASPTESQELARQFPEFNLVITAGGADVPPLEPQKLKETGQLIVEVGHKGMYAVVLGYFADAKKPIRYQVVPLDSRFKDSSPMKKLMASYQHQLRELNWEGLGLRPVRHPRAKSDDDVLGQFAGSQACADCHTKAHARWLETPHAHATETLATLKPSREYDAECISCHATGWNQREYFFYRGGFQSLRETPLLAGNGCENCHGPAQAHVLAESGEQATSAKRQAELRKSLRVSLEDARDNLCGTCHDGDNDPNFSPEAFAKHYWPAIEHPGKD